MSKYQIFDIQLGIIIAIADTLEEAEHILEELEEELNKESINNVDDELTYIIQKRRRKQNE
jgi:hypothetical protein